MDITTEENIGSRLTHEHLRVAARQTTTDNTAKVTSVIFNVIVIPVGDQTTVFSVGLLVNDGDSQRLAPTAHTHTRTHTRTHTHTPLRIV